MLAAGVIEALVVLGQRIGRSHRRLACARHVDVVSDGSMLSKAAPSWWSNSMSVTGLYRGSREHVSLAVAPDQENHVSLRCDSISPHRRRRGRQRSSPCRHGRRRAAAGAGRRTDRSPRGPWYGLARLSLPHAAHLTTVERDLQLGVGHVGLGDRGVDDRLGPLLVGERSASAVAPPPPRGRTTIGHRSIRGSEPRTSAS